MSKSLFFALLSAGILLCTGCEPKSDTPAAPAESSAEAKSLSDAVVKAADSQPVDALELATSVASRNDISEADRAAALKAQHEALKKLSTAAAAGDAEAKAAIQRYQSNR